MHTFVKSILIVFGLATFVAPCSAALFKQQTTSQKESHQENMVSLSKKKNQKKKKRNRWVAQEIIRAVILYPLGCLACIAFLSAALVPSPIIPLLICAGICGVMGLIWYGLDRNFDHLNKQMEDLCIHS